MKEKEYISPCLGCPANVLHRFHAGSKLINHRMCVLKFKLNPEKCKWSKKLKRAKYNNLKSYSGKVMG